MFIRKKDYQELTSEIEKLQVLLRNTSEERNHFLNELAKAKIRNMFLQERLNSFWGFSKTPKQKHPKLRGVPQDPISDR